VSLGLLEAIFDYLDAQDIRLCRMPTALAPYASHPDMPCSRDQPQRFAERWRRPARGHASSGCG